MMGAQLLVAQRDSKQVAVHLSRRQCLPLGQRVHIKKRFGSAFLELILSGSLRSVVTLLRIRTPSFDIEDTHQQ